MGGRAAWRRAEAALLAALWVVSLGASGCRCAGNDRPDANGSATVSAAPTSPRVAQGEPLPAWPELPLTREALDRLLDEFSHGRGSGPPDASAAAMADPPSRDLGATPAPALLRKQLRESAQAGRLWAGWDAIAAELTRRMDEATEEGRPSYLLWGVSHDAEPHVRAFGRLVGPLGLGPSVAAAVELFHADGRWSGVAPSDQAGDDALLDGYLGGGELAALAELRRVQRTHDYAAWKYGYVSTVLELAVGARAAGSVLLGCNMPSSLEHKARVGLGEATERLRELHCAFALRDAVGGASRAERIALLWGQAHLADDRLPALLPPRALIIAVRVFGGRPDDSELEQSLAAKLALGDPVMVEPFPAAVRRAQRLVLVLPEGALGATTERVRSMAGCPLPVEHRGRLILSSETPARAWIDGRSPVELEGEPRSLPLSQGAHGYWIEADEHALVAGLEMPSEGQIELALDVAGRAVTAVVRDCSPAAAVSAPLP